MHENIIVKSIALGEGDSISPTFPKIIIINLNINYKPVECLGNLETHEESLKCTFRHRR